MSVVHRSNVAPSCEQLTETSRGEPQGDVAEVEGLRDEGEGKSVRALGRPPAQPLARALALRERDAPVATATPAS